MTYIEKLIIEMKKQNTDQNYIDLVAEYATKLLEKNLIVIFDLEHFGILTHNSSETLISLLDRSEHYKLMDIPKKNGDTRTLYIPSKNMKQIQRWILNNILEKIPISENAKGFSKGLSIIENAKHHTNKKCVLTIDLKDFFQSITIQTVFLLFKNIGYTKEVADVLSKLCTYNGFLPQGAPTSPYIANLVCTELDLQFSELLKIQDIVYTRYADDLTFSANIDLIEYVTPIKKIIDAHGFQVNNTKTRIIYQHQRQLVTGLIVNNDKPNIPRKLKRRIKQEIYYCKKYGVHGHLKMDKRNKKYYSNYKNHLFGMAYYFKMVDKTLGQKIIDELMEIQWEY